MKNFNLQLLEKEIFCLLVEFYDSIVPYELELVKFQLDASGIYQSVHYKIDNN